MPVRLSDIIDVEVFEDMSAENTPELTDFAGSGIVTQNETLNTLVDESGATAELPYWLDLDASDGAETGGEPNTWSDDPDEKPTHKKLTQESQKTRKGFLHNSWSAMALANELATAGNALDRIVARTDKYWAMDFQRRIVSMSLGIYRSNVANNGSDMVHDISIEDGANAAEANLFGRKAFTSAAFTLGDAWKNTSAMAVHSVVMQRMIDEDQIEYIKDSQGNLTIPTYLGRRIVVDDGCPTIAGTTSGVRFLSVLYGQGVFGYANGTPDVPVELFRDPDAGNGGGMDVLHNRKKLILHPAGFSFTDNTVSGRNGISPTRADLALAANWERKYDRKNVPMAFLVTNG